MFSKVSPTFCSALHLLSMIPACASVDIRIELSALNRNYGTAFIKQKEMCIYKCTVYFKTNRTQIFTIKNHSYTVDQSWDLLITESGWSLP